MIIIACVSIVKPLQFLHYGVTKHIQYNFLRTWPLNVYFRRFIGKINNINALDSVVLHPLEVLVLCAGIHHKIIFFIRNHVYKQVINDTAPFIQETAVHRLPLFQLVHSGGNHPR